MLARTLQARILNADDDGAAGFRREAGWVEGSIEASTNGRMRVVRPRSTMRFL